jgi:23S rRNA (pseudouridine1915-N3)-methyltransferase
MMAAEAQRLRAAMPAHARVVALDEHGQRLTSEGLAQQLSDWREQADPVVFLIGGPDGLDASLKREARLLLRLSDFTLPHGMARVLLAEQLYRAWSIGSGHPYHRA